MRDWILSYLSELASWVLLTLGVILLCGLTVELCATVFSRLIGRGSGAVFDLTAVIGTPVHELGHAAMCLLFAHRIERVRLWSPRARNGMYGFVEHSYNRRNLWARLGNLLIGVGPIFSGLGVTVFTLWLCFPTQWNAHLSASAALLEASPAPAQVLRQSLSLLASLPSAFQADWLRSLVGLLVILSVCLHIRLSWQDIKGSAGAVPLYLALCAILSLFAKLLGWQSAILHGLRLWSLQLLALFVLVLAFSLLWLALALLVCLFRAIKRAF